MKKLALILLAGATLLLAGSAADARRGDRDDWSNYGGYGWITLYSAPYFQGHSVTLYGPTPHLNRYGFDDRAQSIRARGSWTLCSDDNYGGDCVTVYGQVEDLREYNMKRRASSVMPGNR
ncbi:MAG: beta/gamma crystallin family protein [Alphaproteobacteria bacterium]|nr:beta/gamma crystallin family protein [Alphaproteobacteria bacterium]MBL6937357.1 beta/gamma crystallin family protein [Alphaproteobacteria bacterium]MBL7096081.1 beta/gamma crystallin family protein [Alphaproteobacteria bacterium]